jgi:hypothetical protein
MASTGIPHLTEKGRAAIQDLLERAISDLVFRDQLMRDPETVLADSGLTYDEARILGSMKRAALEEWGLDVSRSRAFLRDNGFKIENI